MNTTLIIASLSLSSFASAFPDVCGHDRSSPPAAAPAFDPVTGRDLRVFPPHLYADFIHMALDIHIADMNTPRFTATQTLSFSPLGDPLASLSLDAKAIKITSVKADGFATAFTADGAKLNVTFDPPVPAGQTATLVTSYEVDDPPLGLIWTPESNDWPNRPAQLHTQGQPETNSYWFPCNDFPNDRFTTEITATVPADFLVSSNGRLAEHARIIRTVEDSLGATSMLPFERFHWVQDKPHVPYLVSLVVGKFDVVDLGDKTLPLPVYAPLGRGRDVQATFGRTRAMIDAFSRHLDEPYPWDRYAQVVVWNFGSGGMENTSCTTLHENSVILPGDLDDHDHEGLIAHELAHQWFGDLTTCNSWEHVWLNEGLATFMNTLWIEDRDGKDAYLAEIRGAYDNLADNDKADAPNVQPMASKVYRDTWEPFRRPANPYGKGASIMHMLRVRLGDDLFFRSLAAFIDQHKFQTVETSDLRNAFEQVSGLSLEQFFSQWVFRPGVPSLDVTTSWDESSHTLTFLVNQTQNINADNPAFEFDLPVVIDAGSTAPAVREAIQIVSKSTQATITLPNRPSWIAIDPDLSVLASITIASDEPASLALLEHAPSLPAKVQAVRALASPGTDTPNPVLRRLAADTAQPTSLRVECVKALTSRHADSDIRSVATGSQDSWQVREATTIAMADILAREGDKADPETRARLLDLIAARAGSDSSIKVRAAALRSLGRLQAHEFDAVITRALRVESQGDLVRQAAIEALGSFDTPRALHDCTRFAAPNFDSRTRSLTVETVVKLAHHDRDAAFKFLSDHLADRQLRTRRAAGDGLVSLADPRALDVFASATSHSRGPETARQLQIWTEQLRAALDSK
ncbi:aminopeptidase N [Phycisphaerales bacterium]|nr:aminopeptidase N [Phycisphaerales bacterium]